MPTVHTSYGVVHGTVVSGCDTYYGIPYASPPAGEARYALPTPPAKWGSIDASCMPKEVPQMTMGLPVPMSNPGKKVPGELPSNQSEDSLVLNVTVPPGTARKDGKAVMVWIHGGAFETGAGCIPLYRPTKLSTSQDVVVVTVNYRLSLLGFLHTGNDDVPANLGLHDQVLALQFVRSQIHEFGGDPEKVTVFGESAGAMSICGLMASPLAVGLFRGAILQSGGPCAFITKAQSKQTAELLAKELGRSSAADLDAAFLRSLPAKTLIEAGERMRAKALHVPMCWAPVVSEPLWPHPLTALHNGAGSNIAVMSGIMKDEFKLFSLAIKGKFERGRAVGYLRKRIATLDEDRKGKAEYTTQAGTIVDATALSAGVAGKPLFDTIAGDVTFKVPHERFLDAHRGPAYSYRMEWGSKVFGSTHVVDIPFVFGTHKGAFEKFVGGGGAEADKFNVLVMNAWGAFARDLQPKVENVTWPQHDSLSRPTMVLGRGNKGAAHIERHINTLTPWEGVMTPKL